MMPTYSRAPIHPFSAGAAAGPATATTVPESDPTTSPSLEIPQTTRSSPTSVSSQVARYILPPPRCGRLAAPSVLPTRQQKSRGAIRKANVLANWTSYTDLSCTASPTTSGTLTRSSLFSPTTSTPSTPSTVPHSAIPVLDHSTSTRQQPKSSTRSSFESGSSHGDSDYSSSPTPGRPPLVSGMPNTYFPLHLSTPDPLQALLRGPDGRTLFSTSTDGRTTVIRRIYGRSAQATKQERDGLILAEIEWMDRVRSSRIRFKGVDVDVRIDEYLKETRGGSGQSRMFATADGRMFKWKAGRPGDSAELFECASGKRVSGLLASSNPSTSTSSPLPTPPPTPPIILTPSPSVTPPSSAPAFAGGFEVPSISLSEPETRQEGEKPTLRVHTSVLHLIDQIVVTWVIMERDRSMHKTD